MGTYEQLKAAITAAIKSNGNQEITGAILQSILLSMVNTIGSGAVFKGVATPTTNPGNRDENCFYLAGTVGTYSNFGGFVLNEGLAVLQNSNGNWVGTKILSIALKADTDNIGGSHHLKYNQAAMINLYNVEPISACTENNKLWFKTDGHLYYRQSGTDYDLGTPAYLLYYNGTKIYKWNGSGFTEMNSGGGEPVSLDFKTGESVEDISLFGSRASIDEKTDAQLALMIPTGAVIKALFDAIDSIDTSGGTYDGIDQVVTFSFVASTRVLTLKQSGRTAKTITLPLASTSSPGLISAQDKINLDNAYQKPSGGIPSTDLASGVQTSLGKADTAYQKPSGGIPSSDLAGSIPKTKLASAVQTSLNKADTAYQKPSSGIPSTDLASDVQNKLGKVLNLNGNVITSLWIGTQAEFDALTAYDPNGIYLIKAAVPQIVTDVIPFGLIGFVEDPANKFNLQFNGSNITEYPSSSIRCGIVVSICEKFPQLPSSYVAHQDSADSGSAEATFISDVVLNDYTIIGAKSVKAFIFRLCSDKVSHSSSGILNPRKSTQSWRETSFAWEWKPGTPLVIYDLSTIGDYAFEGEYYFICNTKNVVNNVDQVITESLIYREDFDIFIVPNAWSIKTLLSTTYESLFSGNGWAGGLVIYDNYMIQFFTGGKVVILDKNTLRVIASGTMANPETGYSQHCNAVSCGLVIPQGSSIPYLYISQWTSGKCLCHVQKITWAGGIVECTEVQTIAYTGSKFNSSLNWDWSVDLKTGDLWCYGYAASASDRYGEKIALQFRLPEIPATVETRMLSDNDIISEFAFTFEGAQQDVHIENGFMFYGFSYNNANGTGGVLVIDLLNQIVLSDYIIDLTSLNREPEGIYRKDNMLYITSHHGTENIFDLDLHTVDLLQSNLDEN